MKKLKTRIALKHLRFLPSLLLLLLYGLWAYLHFTSSELPEAAAPPTFYANQCDDDFPHLYLNAIASAQKSILLIIYSLSDETLIKALEEKAKAGVKVKVIQEKRTARRKMSKLIESIKREGNGLMHRKILVVDEEKVWIGSVNLTKESLYLDDNLVMALSSHSLGGCIMEMKEAHITAQSQKIDFYPLPEQKKEALQKLLAHLDSAEESIKVGMFTMTHPLLIESLLKAASRGISVEVVIDRKSADGSSKKGVHTLLQGGLPVYLSRGSHTFHHKFAYIDRKTLIFGSANWTGSAFSKNEEVLLFVHDLNMTQVKKIEKLWHAIKCNREKKMPLVVDLPVVDLRLEPKELTPLDYSHNPLRLTQLLFGESLDLIKRSGEWLLVDAIEQECFTMEKQWHPYRGWVHEKEVQEIPLLESATHVVKAPWTTLLPLNVKLSFGTCLSIDADGNLLYPQKEGCHLNPRDLRPLTHAFSSEQLLEDAKHFLHTPYLWGGRAAYGKECVSSVDCSGLINLLYRAQGIKIPRDAHPQSLKCTKIAKEELKPGDLIYLSRTDKPDHISHVLLYKDMSRLVEAPETGKLVRELSTHSDIKQEGDVLSLKGREHTYLATYGRFRPMK